MVIGDLLKEATQKLLEAGIETARLDSEVLLSSLLKKDRIYLLMNRKEEPGAEIEIAFKSLIARRSHGEPVAYLVGEREFMSLTFSVSPGVLIPRPDTETLVEFVIEKLSEKKDAEILDLCTGSGAIAVSLAHYLPQSRVTAVDISEICIKTTEKNAAENAVADRVTVMQADVFTFESQKLFDCVVSNPPYIPSAVVEGLERDVKDYEPRLALDGGEDGYTFYRFLAQRLTSLLNPGGLLAFEVGHDQAETVVALLQKTMNYEGIGIVHDLAGINRVVYGFKK